MRLATRVLIPLLLLAIAVDFAILDQGAFRFDPDESTAGVRSGARVDVPRVSGLAEAGPLRHATAAILPRRPPRAIGLRLRSDVPAARSHLIVSADSARSFEDH